MDCRYADNGDFGIKYEMMRAIKTYKKYVVRDLLSLTMVILLSSCASYDKEPQHEPPVLKIYVFAPDRPIVTRGDNGYVGAADAENAIHNLHVWVFEHENGKFVGHVSSETGSELSTGQGIFTMEVSDDFASRQPEVDVYVMANVTKADYALGFDLGENTTRAQLDAALIGSNYFGLTSTSLVTSVPDGGLPMTGVLKNQTIFGDAPVFGVGSKTSKTLTNIKLVRAVSKVQFVFTAVDYVDETANPIVMHQVESITLDANTIPNSEYLFLKYAYSAEGGGDPLTYEGYRYWIKAGDNYNSAVATLMGTSIDVNKLPDGRSPDNYVYKTQSGQEYENLIQSGITNHDLTSAGTYYFRESDKQITGTITYDGDKTATFKLSGDDFVAGDFGRNHTWIVYGYFTEKLGIMTVYIKVKKWDDLDPLEHIIYNW